MNCPNCNALLLPSTVYRVCGLLKCGTCGAELPDAQLASGIVRNVQMEPIVIHRRRLDNGDYAYSYPGNSSDPVPDGYERVELSTLAQADRFVKDRNQEEQELRRLQIQAEREHWNERARERRENARVELERRLGKSHSQVGELVQRTIDARREKRYRELESRSVNFHIQALSYDANHIPEHRDESKRKISVVVNGFRR